MASVSKAIGETAEVSLHDALGGTLPPVCCMTGAPADGYAPVVVPRRLGPAWLLLLAGPVGVIVLVLLWPRVRVRYQIRLPLSAAAFERLHTQRVRRLWCAWLGAMGLVLALLLRWYVALAVVVALASLASLAVALWAHFRLPWLMPSMVVDTWGRNLTLRGVHERFERATRRRAERAGWR